jgi:tetrahydromethanopterin S-methyltransferase subunit C
VLDFDGPVNFASRSELMSSCKIVWLAMVLQDGAAKGIGAGLTVSIGYRYLSWCSCH